MKKGEFVDLVKEVGRFETKREALKAVDGFVKAVETALSKGKEVELMNFGKFYLSIQKEREAKAPNTDKKVLIPERKIVRFKAGKQLKELVNQGG